MRAKVIRFIVLLVVCIVGLLPMACSDPVLAVYGTAYEWIDASSSFDGIIYLNEKVNLDDKNLRLLSGVQLSNSANTDIVSSDSSGSISLKSSYKPGHNNITLTAEKEGYYTIEKVFSDGPRSHDVIVIMVKKG